MIVRELEQEFKNPEPGMHNAVCFNIFDLGVQKIEWQKEIKFRPQLIIGWELEAKNAKGERFKKYKKYTANLHEKALLLQHLESWRNKAFTDEELKGFDLENIIGKQCTLNLIEDKNYINISGVMAKMPNVPQLQPETSRDWTPEWVEKLQNNAQKVKAEDNEGNSDITCEDEQIPF